LGDAPRAVLLIAASLIWLVAPRTAATDEREYQLNGGLSLPPGRGTPVVGERWSFHGRWLGIPVGHGWIETKEIVTLDGRQAYHIEMHGDTNEVLSAFYPIHDVIHSYLDVQTLKPLRFEKNQREGNYRANEVVVFDHDRSVATYRSLLNGSSFEVPIPEIFQDLISLLYWFRAQPLQSGKPLTMDVYADEKIYHTRIEVRGPILLELLKRGTFPCVVVEPKASFKGLLVKRGRLWAYLTADEHRLPLLVKATTPWGPMAAVLDEDSIRRSADADRGAAGP
jgi:hypothetical protein